MVDRLLARVLLGLLLVYRVLLSPDHSFWARAFEKPPYCKHIPSCSSYAVTAIERFWGIRWGWLALMRLGRCVPWRAGGYDPVPSISNIQLPPEHSSSNKDWLSQALILHQWEQCSFHKSK